MSDSIALATRAISARPSGVSSVPGGKQTVGRQDNPVAVVTLGDIQLVRGDKIAQALTQVERNLRDGSALTARQLRQWCLPDLPQ